jgi:hypothetical protein
MRLAEAPALLLEVGRVLALVASVERARLRLGTAPAVARARSRGQRTRQRAPEARARLRRAIGAVDALLPGGANCYRRALLEMSLDRGAAGERLYLDLSASGGRGNGHARLASWPEDGRGYDATFSL